jgi:hypothetical protein
MFPFDIALSLILFLFQLSHFSLVWKQSFYFLLSGFQLSDPLFFVKVSTSAIRNAAAPRLASTGWPSTHSGKNYRYFYSTSRTMVVEPGVTSIKVWNTANSVNISEYSGEIKLLLCHSASFLGIVW